MECPQCSTAVARVTVVGPDTALVEPCGHRTRPAATSSGTDRRGPTEVPRDPVPTP